MSVRGPRGAQGVRAVLVIAVAVHAASAQAQRPLDEEAGLRPAAAPVALQWAERSGEKGWFTIGLRPRPRSTAMQTPEHVPGSLTPADPLHEPLEIFAAWEPRQGSRLEGQAGYRPKRLEGGRHGWSGRLGYLWQTSPRTGLETSLRHDLEQGVPAATHFSRTTELAFLPSWRASDRTTLRLLASWGTREFVSASGAAATLLPARERTLGAGIGAEYRSSNALLIGLGLRSEWHRSSAAAPWGQDWAASVDLRYRY